MKLREHRLREERAKESQSHQGILGCGGNAAANLCEVQKRDRRVDTCTLGLRRRINMENFKRG